MTKVTFIGSEGDGNVGEVRWPIGQPGQPQDLVFPLNKPVEVTNAHVLSKITAMAKSGKMFEVEGVKAETAAPAADDDETVEEDESDNGTSASTSTSRSSASSKRLKR